MRRAFLVGLLAAASLAGCGDQPPRTHAEQAAIAGCRQRADEAFLKQNRALLSERTMVDSPFSSTGITGITSAGLGDRFARDQMVSDCVAGLNGSNPSAVSGTATIDQSTGPAMYRSAPLTGSRQLVP